MERRFEVGDPVLNKMLTLLHPEWAKLNWEEPTDHSSPIKSISNSEKNESFNAMPE